MKTKITLSVDPEVVVKARRLSRRKHKSISKLFEEFILRDDRMSRQPPGFIDQITGILKDPGIPYGDMRKEYKESKSKR
jgi:hypothetical protein